MKLIHLIPTLEIGGAETALVRLIENTSWDQEVICLYEKGPLSTKLEARSIKVTSLSMKKTLFSKVVGFIKLLKILYVKKPSHFQTWLYEADFFGFVAAVILKPVLKVKIYFTIRCSDMKLSRLKSQFLKVLAFFSRFVTKCIVNSYAGYAFHEKQGYKNLFLIPNAVDTDYFKPNLYLKESFKKEHSISDQTFVIGMVARLDNIKNHPLLLKAFNILCAKGYDVHLVLAGKGVEVLSGPYRTCLGAVCETSSLYPVFDVSILPSLSEGFANVLAESMSCGVPCIATDVGDNAAIIKNTGVCKNFLNEEDFALEIEKFMHLSKEEKVILSLKARERIQKQFSFTSQIALYERLFY